MIGLATRVADGSLAAGTSTKILLDIPALFNAEFAAGAVLISFGAVLGKVYFILLFSQLDDEYSSYSVCAHSVVADANAGHDHLGSLLLRHQLCAGLHLLSRQRRWRVHFPVLIVII